MRVLLGTPLLLSIPAVAWGQSLADAANRAAESFAQSGGFEAGREAVVGVVNYHSGKRDRTAEEIETELYFALERAFPEIKLIAESEAVAGISSSALHIKGTYRQKGETVTVRLQAISDAIGGEVLNRTSVTYRTQKSGDKTLVAVLDIESDLLSASQRKSFSEIFRSGIARSGRFVLASSSEIDKMDPDEIQRSTGCTRDECGTIVGEQLGVDRVVSSSYTKVTDRQTLLSAKILDIKRSAILKSETVEHDGNLATLGERLENLAVRLTGTEGAIGFVNIRAGGSGLQGGVQRITPRTSGNGRSRVAALFVESSPSGVEVYFGNIKAGVTPYQNLKLKAGQTIRITLKHEGYFDRTVELTLGGGTNEIGPIRLRSRHGRLAVESDPAGADVYIAGAKVGQTPYLDPRIAEGTYLVSVAKPLYFPIENRTVRITAERETRKSYALQPDFGRLLVETEPTGALIRITDRNGETVHSAPSPLKVMLTPGRYRLEIAKKGYESLDFDATIARGESQRIAAEEATLRRLEGDLIVGSNPYLKGADVLIDGEKLGAIPAHLTLPAGSYRLEVAGETKSGTARVEIRDGRSTSVTVDVYDRFSRRETIDRHKSWKTKWISLTAVGIATGLYSYLEYQKAVDARSSQEDEENAIEDGDSDTNARAHRDKALEYNDSVKSHNARSRLSGMVSLAFLGWAWWVYADEPQNPEAARWLASPTPEGGVRLAYSTDF